MYLLETSSKIENFSAVKFVIVVTWILKRVDCRLKKVKKNKHSGKVYDKGPNQTKIYSSERNFLHNKQNRTNKYIPYWNTKHTHKTKNTKWNSNNKKKNSRDENIKFNPFLVCVCSLQITTHLKRKEEKSDNKISLPCIRHTVYSKTCRGISVIFSYEKFDKNMIITQAFCVLEWSLFHA